MYPAEAWIPVFSTTRKREVRHRALVLQARGIAHTEVRQADGFVLLVPAADEVRATEELARYEAENHAWPPRQELPPLAREALIGSLIYGILVILFYAAQSQVALGLDWTATGLSDSERVLGGELWRPVTSLFLHADGMHAGSNILFGAAFGLLVAQLHGPGLGWLTILFAGIFGNLLNAWLHGPGHFSLGASTAVFGAIGALVGSEWRRRKASRQSLTRRLGPAFGGLLLYGWLGVGGERTDVLAHLFGFLAGIPLGMLLGFVPQRFVEHRGIQLAAGLAALAVIGIAWGVGFGAKAA